MDETVKKVAAFEVKREIRGCRCVAQTLGPAEVTPADPASTRASGDPDGGRSKEAGGSERICFLCLCALPPVRIVYEN
jgi:hypothetical protein